MRIKRIKLPWGRVLCSTPGLSWVLRYRLIKENRPLVIMPTHPKLTQVPRVIHDVLDVLGRPQGSYAESFVSISPLLAEIRSGTKQNISEELLI